MLEQLETWLGTIPPLAVYAVTGLIIGLESMGLPVPGELTLITASLLAAGGAVDPWGVAIGASTGAIIGDSIGYLIGRRGGRALLERLGRRFPKHLGPAAMAAAEARFMRWGFWAVFFGRFIALLRILAGPVAGTLRMPYLRFLVANATGGVVWAGGTTFAIYYAGRAAEQWLHRSSWVVLALAVAAGVATTVLIRKRTRRGHAPARAEAASAAGD